MNKGIIKKTQSINKIRKIIVYQQEYIFRTDPKVEKSELLRTVFFVYDFFYN